MSTNDVPGQPIRSDDFKKWPVSYKQIDLPETINKIISMRIRSSFIYPIAQLEEIFGDLWGEFKDEKEDLTPQEEQMLERFLKWRKSVLDYGNREIRLAENEVYKYLK